MRATKVAFGRQASLGECAFGQEQSGVGIGVRIVARLGWDVGTIGSPSLVVVVVALLLEPIHEFLAPYFAPPHVMIADELNPADSRSILDMFSYLP